MYFLLDLCCKAVSSKAEALAAGGAAAGATAAAGPASAAAATPEASSSRAQRPPAAVPGHLGSSATPAPHATDNAAGTAAAVTPGPQPAAAPAPAAPAAASGINPTTTSSSSSTAEKLQEAFNKQEPCKKRACTTAIDAFAAFQSAHFKHTRGGAGATGGSSSSSSQQAAAAATAAAAGATAAGVAAAAAAPPAAAEAQQQQQLPVASSSSSAQQQATSQLPADQQPTQQQPQAPQQQQQQPKQPVWFYEDEPPCPPDILKLGRSTWTLLHSMAAYYPEQPSPQQQASMASFISALGEFYPCDECAGHLRKELAKHPPDVGSASALSAWACRLHNKVNVRLGKPEFDCSRVFERWRDGPQDDPDACGPAH